MDVVRSNYVVRGIGLSAVGALLAFALAGCGRTAPATSAEPALNTAEADLAYCQATIDCEGTNPGVTHHVCVNSPIPFGMMLCEGPGASSVAACTAAVRKFRAESKAYGCESEYSALTGCLSAKSECKNAEYDQSACVAQMKSMTACVSHASGYAALPNSDTSCKDLVKTCASCKDAKLAEQCQYIASSSDDGTCTQALTAIEQACL